MTRFLSFTYCALNTILCGAQLGSTVEIGISAADYQDIQIIDFDGDGDLDILHTDGETFLYDSYLVTAPPDAGMFKLFSNNGDGTFTTGELLSLEATSYFAFGDVNNDSHTDFIYTDVNDIYYRQNLGDNTFSAAMLVYSLPLVPPFEETDPGYDEWEDDYTIWRLQVGDTNTDGMNEIIFIADGRVYSSDPVSMQYGNIYTCAFTGPGFEAPVFLLQGVYFLASINYYQIIDLQISDFNMDGLNDIYYSRLEGIGFDNVFHYAIAPGLFDESGSLDSYNFSTSIEDMNLDGMPDKVSAYYSVPYGWFNISGYIPDFFIEPEYNLAAGIAPVRVNADDLADVVLIDTSGTFYVYPQVDEWLTYDQWQYFPGSYTHDAGINEQVDELTYFDYNNDGTEDILFTAGGHIYVVPVQPAGNEASNINLQLFIDADSDYIFDGDESPYFSSSVTLVTEIEDSMSYYSLNGQFNLSLEDGHYILLINDNSIYYDSYVAMLEFDVSSEDTIIYIGFTSQDEVVHAVEPVIMSEIGVCAGNPVFHHLHVYNAGNAPASGTVIYTLNDAQSFLSADIAPLTVNGNVITWEYTDLLPMQQLHITLTISATVIDFLGEMVTDSLHVYIVDENANVIIEASEHHSQVVLCSYDPNDITEYNGYTDNGYVFAGSELEYVIRFQNTGNAPAQNVRIENQLPSETDWNSIQPKAWSHDFTMEMDDSGYAIFYFNNIMLPDSGTDQEGSSGYIVYTVMAQNDLLPADLIHNTAEIYFDFNPAVITNTEINTIYDCEDLEQAVVFDTEVCTGEEILLSNDAAWIETLTWSFDGQETGTGNYSHVLIESGIMEMQASNALCSYDETWQLTANSFEAAFSVNGNAMSAVNGMNYQWYLDGDLIDGATDQEFVAEESGNYSVLVTGANGCSDMSEVVNVAYEGIAFFGSFELLVYPNPASEDVTLVLPAGIVADVSITDLNGRELMTRKNMKGNVLLEVNKLPQGIYLLTAGEWAVMLAVE